MHLLAATSGRALEGMKAVDLGQSPGDIVILSAADTELACLSTAWASIKPRLKSVSGSGSGDKVPTLRLANLLQLAHNLSVDLYVDKVVNRARLVIVRLIGGVGYWPYGIEQIAAAARKHTILLAVVPGDDRPDPDLLAHSTLDETCVARIWRYFDHGGVGNARNMLSCAVNLIGWEARWAEPAPVPRAGLYGPRLDLPGLSELRAGWEVKRPVAAIVFYRALVQAGNTRSIDALIAALSARGLDALPIHVSSLKEDTSAALVSSMLAECRVDIVLNATGFAISHPGAERVTTPFDVADCPVLQVIFSGNGREAWEVSAAGLSVRDIAMNVALPEVDGRLHTRAVSFKAEAHFDVLTECSIVTYAPVADRIDFVAELAAGWVRLARTAPADRRLALVLANYPNKDARIGNGVGLDTPESIIRVAEALALAGYRTDGMPSDSESLMRRILFGPTNERDTSLIMSGSVRYSLGQYKEFFSALPRKIQNEVTEQWGTPENDPFVQSGDFLLPIHRFGNVVVAVQPARGYNIDPKATYHDPALVPPHGYLAFHAWLRRDFDVNAVIHMGKHGNLEWLPGKALALSQTCYPEVALGALPNLYPFIVNDPGEGSQAKRRAAAAVIDHLTPPLTRAETYGPLRDLEVLIDEYYEAAALDPRRLEHLAGSIIDLVRRIGLDKDCGISAGDTRDAQLQKLDTHLCELKEMQIRDGLHVFGVSPEGGARDDLLVALVRAPRGSGNGSESSLHRALAADLGLADFDPLNCAMAEPWTGPRPLVLANLLANEPWRTTGDVVERLELLALALVSGSSRPEPGWARAQEVLNEIKTRICPAVIVSGPAEIDGLLRGLDGRFVPPGPSGAPTRGRPEVLPTGRNFYSVDTRAVPTAAAWHLGWRAAGILLDRHRQEHGEWPRNIALSAWGTANMRTGGDDIAQALALIGARPDWEPTSGRVVGFEILPLSLLDRPRVDVTFRISGFFRDAFPYQVGLLDAAIRAVASLDEPETMNPLAATVRRDADRMVADGDDADKALQRAGFRVFGSKPGAYGAGLQALIDEGIWGEDSDLARAYLAWGGYAYGDETEGAEEYDLFEARLRHTQVVVHNQDNREHDLLDSDDYYQFEGGLAASVRYFSGHQPAVYHGDHSQPGSPRIRTLEEEVARVVRARVVNPKWIAGVMRHGYKGAFEMAATVDYLFAFAATARCVRDHHFDAVFEAYLEDPEVLTFLDQKNPAARVDIARRLAEAVDRGLWRPSRNVTVSRLAELKIRS